MKKSYKSAKQDIRRFMWSLGIWRWRFKKPHKTLQMENLCSQVPRQLP